MPPFAVGAKMVSFVCSSYESMSYSSSANMPGGNMYAQKHGISQSLHFQQHFPEQNFTPGAHTHMAYQGYMYQPNSSLDHQTIAQATTPAYQGYMYPPNSGATTYSSLHHQTLAQAPPPAYQGYMYPLNSGATTYSSLHHQTIAQAPPPAYQENMYHHNSGTSTHFALHQQSVAQVPAQDYALLEELSTECQHLQRESAKKLRIIANILREEEWIMSVAKVIFNSAGVVGGGLSITGAVLAPFTAGASVGLSVAGSAIGLLAGGGDFVTWLVESTIIGNRLDEVQKVLNHLTRTTEELLSRLRPQLEAFGISWIHVLKFLYKSGSQVWGGYTLYTNIQKAIDVARVTTQAQQIALSLQGCEKVTISIAEGMSCASSCPKLAGRISEIQAINVHAEQIAISLGGGEKVAKAVAEGMCSGSSCPKLAGGLAGIKALDATSKVTKVAGPIGSAIGIGFSLKAIVNNSMRIHGNVSEVADVIERIADALLVMD